MKASFFKSNTSLTHCTVFMMLLTFFSFKDQGTQHKGHVVHRQEHDGVCGAGGRDHCHPAHHSVQRQEGRQFLHTAQGEKIGHYKGCLSSHCSLM